MTTETRRTDHAPVDVPAENGVAHGVDGERLRTVMRHVASPVTVVTAAAGLDRRGATIGSFTSVSLDPPLISFNVQKASSLYVALLAADRFAVHVLGDGQADLANHFALPDLSSAEQFDPVLHADPGPDRPPILRGTYGVLHCARYAAHDAGDHALMLGLVLRVTSGDAEGPLLYYDRSYRAVGPEV